MADSKRQARKQQKQLTLGLLVTHLRDVYENGLFVDLMAAARRFDVNLLCYVGSDLGNSLQENAVFDLISAERIQGLIISPTLAHGRDAETMRSFLQRYAPIPIVGGALNLEEVTQVIPDSLSGMRQLVDHLLDMHAYRHLAFIQGPPGQREAEERYQAYHESLTAHAMAVDEALVLTGDYSFESGIRAMHTLLSRGVAFDAVVAANDDMALGAYRVLQEQGLRVPEDVALTGFDDVVQGQNLSVPLTTVRQEFALIAEKMIESLVQQIQGAEAQSWVRVPTTLKVRRSCGCQLAPVQHAYVDLPLLSSVPEDVAVDVVPEAVPAELWRVFWDEVNANKDGVFLSLLDQLVRDTYEAHEDVTEWQHTLTRLRDYALHQLVARFEGQQRFARIMRAENVFQQARVMVSEAAQRWLSLLRYTEDLQSLEVQSLDQAMATVLELPELSQVVEIYLPDLNIQHCSVALYEGEMLPTSQVKLLLAYEGGDAHFHERGTSYDAALLWPNDLWQDAQHSGVVMPLVLRERVFGLVYLGFGPTQGVLYERIANQLSGAIFRAQLIQQQQQAQLTGETLLAEARRRASLLAGAAEISRVTTSITNLSDLLPQAVRLIRDRFNLYYAGIFLVDEARRWAVLRAGTGDAGKKMLENGHKLEVGSTSMIGSCVATGEARISFDIEHEAVLRKNPLLPETRSEMALPLISRDQVIGAMTIQSVEPRAFSEEDITTLQTMADQLANAIENARLFEQMEQSRRELEIASGRYTQEAWQQFVQRAGQIGYRYRLTGVEPAQAPYPEAEQALRHNAAVLDDWLTEDGTPKGRALGVPIRLRDQVLGVLNLRFDEGEVPPETVALVEQIADRLAISLESARLLQETSSTAAREQSIAQVTGRMRESLDVDAVVRTAAEQILEVMDLSSVTIRLAPRSEQTDEG